VSGVGAWGSPVYGLGRVGAAASCVLLRTAVNFPPPSWALAGAQHITMLEPMHARIPQTAPIAPGHEAPKPIIEKREKTKHAMTKHLALFASLGRLTLSLHISVAAGDGAMPAPQ